MNNVDSIPTDTLGERDQLMTTDELAVLLNIPPSTLNKNRSTGLFKMPYVKIVAQVRYRRSDVEKYLQDNTHNPC